MSNIIELTIYHTHQVPTNDDRISNNIERY
jgi:hypothetical protein